MDPRLELALRGLAPLLTAALAAAWNNEAGPWVVAVGGVGLGWMAAGDAGAPVRTWRRRHPTLRFARVRALPRDGALLDGFCRAATAALQTPGAGRAQRRQIEDLLGAAAALAVQREAIVGVDGLGPRPRDLDRRFDALVSAARSLRRGLVRAELLRRPDLDPLTRVHTTVGELDARSALEEELAALDPRGGTP